jgi:small subunit ribosomal protein S13
MVYIHNTNCPNSKKLYKALTDIYGLGTHHSLQICDVLGVCPNTRLSECTSSQIAFLSQTIAQNYETGVEIRRNVAQNIQKFINIASYRGFRHVQGLPVRGQRTRGNHKTASKLQGTRRK